MRTHAVITGVGITPMTSPRRQLLSKNELCRAAVDLALEHANCRREDVDTVIVGDIAGFEASAVAAKTIAPALGLPPLTPVFPINTGGTTGGHLANQAASLVRAGFAKRIVCVGPNTITAARAARPLAMNSLPVRAWVRCQEYSLDSVHGVRTPAKKFERVLPR